MDLAPLRSVLFAIAFYGGTLFAVAGALVVAPFGAHAIRRYGVGWARYHRWCARVLLGITSRVEGPVPREPVIVAAKHQSMYETLELLLILPAPAIVLKRELTDIPLWGRIAIAYGGIPVDRAGSASALRRMLRAAEPVMAERRMIVIFPEGTRVAAGETPALKPGFAGLYRMLRLPVAPVALDSARLWPRRSFVKRAGVVTFRFAEPIPAGLSRREAEARVHAAINALEPAVSAR